MKRICVYKCGTPEVMQVEDAPEPQPEAGQVVVQVTAVGVNPVDTYIRDGGQGYAPQLPYTPGFDAAGVVEAVGDGVTNVSVADRVYCAGTLSGAYAEKVVCNECQVYPLPQQVSFSQGAAVPIPYATAYRALFQKAKAEPGDVVLVHGASGGVGLAAVQLAHASGMKVIGTAGSARGHRLVIEQGVRHVFDHHHPEHGKHVIEATGGEGVNVILEMLANVNLGEDLPLLAKGGRVVVIGCRGDAHIMPRHLMGRDAAILGMVLMNASQKELASIHAFLVKGLENEILRPVVGKELPLDQAAQAHHLIMESPAYGKIVLVP